MSQSSLGGLPNIATDLPGPQSIQASAIIGLYEANGISSIAKGFQPILWRSGSGANLVDLDGNRFLDFTSSFGVAATGYGHPAITEAIRNQSTLLIHTMAGIFPHALYGDLLKAVEQSVGRWNKSQVLLTTSGSEAVEVALKLAVSHTGKPGVLAFEGSFHGQTLGALSVTSYNEMRNPFLQGTGGMVRFVPFPNPYRPPLSASPGGLTDACLEYIRRLIRSGASGCPPIGGVLIEPMQNASGYIIPPEGFLRELRALCTELEILLITDEIFTGFGRSGYWLASDREEVIPDIVCVGKAMTGGLPIAACLADESLMASIRTDSIVPLHGSTFMANPIACAASLAAITTLRQASLIERSRSLGLQLRDTLGNLAEPFPFVGQVRGLGLAIAIEFVEDKASKARSRKLAEEFAARMMNRGIVTLLTGLPYFNIVALCPPFVVNQDQMDFAVATARDVLEEMS